MTIKNFFLALLTAAAAISFAAAPAFSDTAITSGNFPDANFRYYVSSDLDLNQDGYLNDSEINAVTIMDVSGKNIDSLAGIEYFTALQELYCYSNNLVSLDVSQISGLMLLECDNNYLTKLDVTKNIELINLECEANNLAELDLSNNINLSYVKCYTQFLPHEIALSNDKASYDIDMTNYVSDLSKITDITAYNDSDDVIESSFDKSAGILVINAYPKSIKYGYDVRCIFDASMSMDVTIRITDGGEIKREHHGYYGGGGCSLFGSVFALSAVVFAFLKRER